MEKKPKKKWKLKAAAAAGAVLVVVGVNEELASFLSTLFLSIL